MVAREGEALGTRLYQRKEHTVYTPSPHICTLPPYTHTPQLINFKFVPLAHQLNFVLVVSVLWATFLSWSSGEAEKRKKREEEGRRGKPSENATTES